MSVILTDYDNDNGYPMATQQVPRRTVVLRGKWRRRSRQVPEPAVSITMKELTPPIQSDAERGEGDSTNARMHKLLKGQN